LHNETKPAPFCLKLRPAAMGLARDRSNLSFYLKHHPHVTFLTFHTNIIMTTAIKVHIEYWFVIAPFQTPNPHVFPHQRTRKLTQV
jgi:hypothetical protein